MAKRLLMAITPPLSGDLRDAARSAAAIARKSGGAARMITVRPIPPPRVDRYDRVVADPDREMARLAEAAEEQMAALRWEFGEVDVERVVRFGRLGAELAIEAAAWDADLIGLAAPARSGLRHQLRACYLGLTLAVPVVLLPASREDADGRSGKSVTLPAFP
jgi:nucleotide-binding universal stress UspA family protein